jgi:hypothetical protein
MSLIIKKNTTFKIPKDRVVAPITLGPPLPSTILLQGGWKNYYNDTVIDGSYIKGSGTWNDITIFYYNPNILLGDGYTTDGGFNYYPVILFNSPSIFNPYVPCWIIFADDVTYTNSSTNNQVIPSTNWNGAGRTLGTIQAVN